MVRSLVSISLDQGHKKLFYVVGGGWGEGFTEYSEVFCKKCVLKNFANFTGKQLCQSLFFNKVAGLRLNNFLKAAHCLGLVKCFKIFQFNSNFWKFNYFSAFIIYNNMTIKQ